MILALREDGGLYVYGSPEDIVRQIEALDIEDTLRAAYDENGQRYVVEWLRPNRYGRSLGLLPWCENGEYRVVPQGQVDPVGLLRAIQAAQWIAEEHKNAVAEVLRTLRGTEENS